MHGVAETDHGVERTLADHLAAVEWSDLPLPAREQASRAVLWWLATALEGATEPEQASLIRYVMAQESKEESTLVGTPYRASSDLAGLVNGRAGKAFEHEDKYWVDESIGFAVGCCVVPAALAAAEARSGVSGRSLLAAVALGIDLEARLIAPLGLGFIPGRSAANATFALGNYGAAAAAAKVYGLNASGHLDALGLAHAQACGNFQGQVEGRSVALQAGIGVRNGLVAARLASFGVSGVRASITGRAGLYAVHYPGSDVDPDRIVEGLGSRYLGTRLGYKAYPCGIVAHPALDALRSLLPRIGSAEVARIEVTGPPSLQIMAEPIDVKRAPASDIEAMFSIPMARAGEAPRPPLNLLGDYAGGAAIAAFGIVCALFETRGSGQGQVVDAAMVDGVALLTTKIQGLRAAGLFSDEAGTNSIDSGAPFYDTYPCADGEYIAVGALEPAFYAEFVARLGVDLSGWPDQSDRAHWPRLRELIGAVIASQPQAHWTSVYDGTDACVSGVLSFDQAAKHPHNVERALYESVDGALHPAPAPRLSRTPARPVSAPEATNQTMSEVLARWEGGSGA
jgi:2-methylcitrate dehydratase PrpD